MSIKIDRLLLRAKKLSKKGQLDEAKEIYVSVLESFPSNKEAKNGLLELNHNESVKPGQKQLEDLVDIAIYECEKYYPAFHIILFEDSKPQEALKLCEIDTLGRA